MTPAYKRRLQEIAEWEKNQKEIDKKDEEANKDATGFRRMLLDKLSEDRGPIVSMEAKRKEDGNNAAKMNAVKKEKGDDDAFGDGDDGERARARDALETSRTASTSSSGDDGGRRKRDGDDGKRDGERKRGRSSQSPERKADNDEGENEEGRAKKRAKRKGVDPAKYARRNTAESIAAARARYFERCQGTEMEGGNQEMVC